MRLLRMWAVPVCALSLGCLLPFNAPGLDTPAERTDQYPGVDSSTCPIGVLRQKILTLRAFIAHARYYGITIDIPTLADYERLISYERFKPGGTPPTLEELEKAVDEASSIATKMKQDYGSFFTQSYPSGGGVQRPSAASNPGD